MTSTQVEVGSEEYFQRAAYAHSKEVARLIKLGPAFVAACEMHEREAAYCLERAKAVSP